MATAYKYVEREATDNINWAEVGANFSGMLQEEMRVRQEKKDAIDESTREYQKVLNNVPQGENGDLNGMALGFADDLQKQALMQETLLKSGQLDPRQYTIMRQNLADGTDQGFGLLQDYNDEYSAKMAMLDPNLPVSEQLSSIDLEIMSGVEGFANFNESKLVINPQTGMVSMAGMIKDPNNPDGALIPDPDPNNLVSVANLKNRIKTKITKYDVQGNAQKWTESLGEDVIQTVTSMGSTYSAGTIKKITDITARKGGIKDMNPTELANLASELGVQPNELKAYSLYQEAQNNWADGQVSDENFSGASILMDFVDFTPDGKEYTSSFNPADVYVDPKDPSKGRKPGTENIILLKNVNGRTQTELSEEQNNVAKRALKSQTGVQVDYKEEVETERMKYEPSAANKKADQERADKFKKEDNEISMIGNLWGGDDTSLKASTDYFRDQNESIKDVTRDTEGVTVLYTNDDGEEESRNISFYVTESNPDYDENKPIGPDNRKERRKQFAATQEDVDAGRATAVGEMIDKRKTQAEFIKSAGPLLTGQDDIGTALERGNYNQDAEFNVEGTSTSEVQREEAPLDYDVEIDEYNDKLFRDKKDFTYTNKAGNEVTGKSLKELFFDDEEDVGSALQALYPEYNITFDIMDDDKIAISIPGHPQADPLVIEADFYDYQDDKAVASMNSVQKWIKAFEKQELKEGRKLTKKATQADVDAGDADQVGQDIPRYKGRKGDKYGG
tara:strand:- start:7367 stop:9565 length:2199 start_codon:yes stop_codon:yes gene_type:complete